MYYEQNTKTKTSLMISTKEKKENLEQVIEEFKQRYQHRPNLYLGRWEDQSSTNEIQILE